MHVAHDLTSDNSPALSLPLPYSQMIKNWRSGTARGLSFVFLAEWLIGDVTNLIGCILTNQVATQVRHY